MSTLDPKLETKLPQVEGQVLVALYQTYRADSADIDPATVMFQYYSEEAFEEYEREDEKENKVNDIHKLGLKYQVIKGSKKVTAPKVSEIKVDGVVFTLTEDDGGFVAEEKDPKGSAPIKADGAKKKDVIAKLEEEIKLANA